MTDQHTSIHMSFGDKALSAFTRKQFVRTSDGSNFEKLFFRTNNFEKITLSDGLIFPILPPKESES